MLLLTEGAADANGVRHWSPTDLNPGLQDFDGDGVREVVWGGQAPIDGQARWILQAVDAAGNVAIETARGHLDVAGPPARTSAIRARQQQSRRPAPLRGR